MIEFYDVIFENDTFVCYGVTEMQIRNSREIFFL